MLMLVLILVVAVLVVVLVVASKTRMLNRMSPYMARHYAVDSITGIVALTMLGIGISMFLAPDTYSGSNTFSRAVDLANGPSSWGVVMGLVSIWLLGALAFGDKLGLTLTSIGACGVWTVWALAIAVNIGDSAVVPAPAMAFLALAGANSVGALVYAREYVQRLDSIRQVELEERNRHVLAYMPGQRPFTQEDRETILGGGHRKPPRVTVTDDPSNGSESEGSG